MNRDRIQPWILFGIVALAIGVRALHAVGFADTALFDVLVGEGRSQDAWARRIAAGGFGSEVLDTAPLRAGLMALVYTLFGDGFGVPRAVQIGLGALGCAALALAGRTFFSARVGVIAGLGLALYAPAVYYDGLLQAASLGLFFASATLWMLAAIMERPSRARVVATGALLGGFVLTVESSVLLLPLVGIWLWLGFGDAQRARELRWPAALVLGAALVLAPVMLRNQVVGQDSLLVDAQLGAKLWAGNHVGATGRYQPLAQGREGARFTHSVARGLAERESGRALDPAEVSSYWVERALASIRDQPLEWAGLLARKAGLVWHAHEVADSENMATYRETSPLLDTLARVLHFGVIAPFAFLGLLATRSRWRELWLLYGMVLSIAAIQVVLFVVGRERVLLVPVVMLFAAAGVIEAVRALRERRGRALALGTACLLATALAANRPLADGRDPRFVTTYEVGLGLLERQRIEESETWLARAIEIDPEVAQAWVGLGLARGQRGDLAGAVESYRQAVLLAPDNPAAHTGLGVGLLMQGDSPAAFAAFRHALDADPDYADAHGNLATALLQEGEARAAIGHFMQALRSRPGNADLHANLAAAYLLSGDLESALESLDRALLLNPGQLQAQANRAATLRALGRSQEALEAYRAVLPVLPAAAEDARRQAREAIEELEAGSG